MDFDLNALFSRVIEKEEKKPEKIEIEETKKAEFNLDSTVDTLKLYDKINKKLIKDSNVDTEKEVIVLMEVYMTLYLRVLLF